MDTTGVKKPRRKKLPLSLTPKGSGINGAKRRLRTIQRIARKWQVEQARKMGYTGHVPKIKNLATREGWV